MQQGSARRECLAVTRIAANEKVIDVTSVVHQAISFHLLGSPIRLAGLIAVLTVAVVGCGGRSEVRRASGAHEARCHTDQLAAALGRTGVAAGSVGTSIVLRNVSPTACSLDGYPSIQLLGAAGTRIQTIVNHGPEMVIPPHLRVRMVRLAPGHSARVYIGYTNVGGFLGVRGFAGCAATVGVRLRLPGDHSQITLKVSIGGATEMGGRIQCGALSVSPVTRAITGWA